MATSNTETRHILKTFIAHSPGQELLVPAQRQNPRATTPPPRPSSRFSGQMTRNPENQDSGKIPGKILGLAALSLATRDIRPNLEITT